MITKASLKGRGFEIRACRIREPKLVPESQKKARNPQVTVATFPSRRMCTQILVKPGPFLDPRSILEVACFWASGMFSNLLIGVTGEREGQESKSKVESE